jgi:NitT/TauT family transport system substrate-binding protein
LALRPVLRVLLCACLLLGGCTAAVASSTRGPEEPAALRFAVLPIVDTVALHVAEREGLFAEEGVQVELVPAASAAERDQLLSSGRADGAVTDLVAVALFTAGGEDLQVVCKARQAFPGAAQFAIVAAKGAGIEAPADLAGVEIGVSQNTLPHYVTERLLEHSGLQADQIRIVHVPQIPVRLQLLLQGQLQAASLPDPFYTLALLKGARLVLDDSTLPEISVSVVAFRKAVMDKRRAAVGRFVRAYGRALELIRQDPEKYADLLVELGRVPAELQGAYKFPPLPPLEVPSRAQWDDVTAWMIEKGLLREAPPYEAVVDKSFVP